MNARSDSIATVARGVDHADSYPLDDRGLEILDQLEASSTPPFRWSERIGEGSYWVNAQGAPADGYETALDRLAPDWRQHLTHAP